MMPKMQNLRMQNLRMQNLVAIDVNILPLIDLDKSLSNLSDKVTNLKNSPSFCAQNGTLDLQVLMDLIMHLKAKITHAIALMETYNSDGVRLQTTDNSNEVVTAVADQLSWLYPDCDLMVELHTIDRFYKMLTEKFSKFISDKDAEKFEQVGQNEEEKSIPFEPQSGILSFAEVSAPRKALELSSFSPMADDEVVDLSFYEAEASAKKAQASLYRGGSRIGRPPMQKPVPSRNGVSHSIVLPVPELLSASKKNSSIVEVKNEKISEQSSISRPSDASVEAKNEYPITSSPAVQRPVATEVKSILTTLSNILNHIPEADKESFTYSDLVKENNCNLPQENLITSAVIDKYNTANTPLGPVEIKELDTVVHTAVDSCKTLCYNEFFNVFRLYKDGYTGIDAVREADRNLIKNLLNQDFSSWTEARTLCEQKVNERKKERHDFLSKWNLQIDTINQQLTNPTLSAKERETLEEDLVSAKSAVSRFIDYNVLAHAKTCATLCKKWDALDTLKRESPAAYQKAHDATLAEPRAIMTTPNAHLTFNQKMADDLVAVVTKGLNEYEKKQKLEQGAHASRAVERTVFPFTRPRRNSSPGKTTPVKAAPPLSASQYIHT